MAITASDARRNLVSLIEQVNDDGTSIEINSRRGSAVLMSLNEYDALQETAHLLRTPANALRILERLIQAEAQADYDSNPELRASLARVAQSPSARRDREHRTK